MMFSVGYQFCEDMRLIETIVQNKEKISELYFSFGDFPNGRNCVNLNNEYSKWEMFERQKEDFERINKAGLKFNLLLNGNCYGRVAQSRSFFCKIGDTLEYLGERYNLTCVTTTSPLIAKFIKQNFDGIEVRASVNMEIGTPQGLDYIADLFDSFYLKREYNRNLKKITAVREWCNENGKKLYGLANSGCLNFCSTHTFHDNLVAHESEISEMDNAYQFEGQCWQYLKKEEKRPDWLRITNFIRPEDVGRYDDLFDGLKIATRVAKNPTKIVTAYCVGSYSGNLADLLEPNHAGLFYPEIIENKKIPDTFSEVVLNCDKNCKNCGYCNAVQKDATVII